MNWLKKTNKIKKFYNINNEATSAHEIKPYKEGGGVVNGWLDKYQGGGDLVSFPNTRITPENKNIYPSVFWPYEGNKQLGQEKRKLLIFAETAKDWNPKYKIPPLVYGDSSSTFENIGEYPEPLQKILKDYEVDYNKWRNSELKTWQDNYEKAIKLFNEGDTSKEVQNFMITNPPEYPREFDYNYKFSFDPSNSNEIIAKDAKTFVDDAKKLGEWYKKNKGYEYSIVPTYADSTVVKEALSKIDSLDDVALYGHHSTHIMGGIPNSYWNRWISEKNPRNCILGTCNAQDVANTLPNIKNMWGVKNDQFFGTNPYFNTLQDVLIRNTDVEGVYRVPKKGENWDIYNPRKQNGGLINYAIGGQIKSNVQMQNQEHNLKELLNFGNYNKKMKRGGWLNKYQGGGNLSKVEQHPEFFEQIPKSKYQNRLDYLNKYYSANLTREKLKAYFPELSGQELDSRVNNILTSAKNDVNSAKLFRVRPEDPVGAAEVEPLADYFNKGIAGGISLEKIKLFPSNIFEGGWEADPILHELSHHTGLVNPENEYGGKDYLDTFGKTKIQSKYTPIPLVGRELPYPLSIRSFIINSPGEMKPFLDQLRYMYNLDPEKKYTKEELIKKGFGNNATWRLLKEAYSEDDLINMMNEIVSAPSTESDIPRAENGGKILTYQEGGEYPRYFNKQNLPTLAKPVYAIIENDKYVKSAVDKYNKLVDFYKNRQNGKMSPEEIEYRKALMNSKRSGYGNLYTYSNDGIYPESPSLPEAVMSLNEIIHNVDTKTEDPATVTTLRENQLAKYWGLPYDTTLIVPSTHEPSRRKDLEGIKRPNVEWYRQETINDFAKNPDLYNALVKGGRQIIKNEDVDTNPNVDKLKQFAAFGSLGNFTIDVTPEKDLVAYDEYDLDPPFLRKIGYSKDFNMMNYPFTFYGNYPRKEVIERRRKLGLLPAEFKKGGIIKDNNGYWNPNNWGKPVEIASNNITMRGVNQPLLGISDMGDVQYMSPGNDYKFKGNTVTEIPIAQKGGHIGPLGSVGILKDLANMEIRGRLANNLHPYGYDRPLTRLFTAGILNKKEKDRELADLVSKVHPNEYYQRRIDALNMLMGFKQPYNSFPVSQYKPSIGKQNKIYYTIGDSSDNWKLANNRMYDNDYKKINDPKNNSRITRDVITNLFKDYKISEGEDKEGKYKSYYDKWDVPGYKLLGLNPPEFYDRVYDKDESYSDGGQIPIAQEGDTIKYINRETLPGYAKGLLSGMQAFKLPWAGNSQVDSMLNYFNTFAKYKNQKIKNPNAPMSDEELDFRTRAANAQLFGYPSSIKDLLSFVRRVDKGQKQGEDFNKDVLSDEYGRQRKNFVYKYYGLPYDTTYLVPSRYTPGKRKGTSTNYEFGEAYRDDIVKTMEGYKDKPIGFREQTTEGGQLAHLGTFTVERGEDKDTGRKFTAILDNWNIDPNNEHFKTLVENLGIDYDKFNYPFDFYTRIYDDEIPKEFNIEQKQQGGLINYAAGGQIGKFQNGAVIKPYDNSLKANINRTIGKVKSKVPESFWFLPGLSDVDDVLSAKEAFSIGTTLDKGIATAGLMLPFLNTKAIKKGIQFAKDKIKYSPVGNFIQDFPRSFEEIKESQRIKNRINTATFGDVQEWKKSRMLAGTVPNYDKTNEVLDRFLNKKNLSVDTWEEYEKAYPVKRTYIQRIRYPKVNILNEVTESGASPNMLRIGLYHYPPNSDPMKRQNVSPFNLGMVFNHELDHHISHPTVQDKSNMRRFLDFRNLENYYRGAYSNPVTNYTSFGTEIKARLGQIKDLLGVKGLEQITKPQLRAGLKAVNNPTKYKILNNFYTDNPISKSATSKEVPLFRRVTNVDKMLEYMNDVPLNPYLTAHKKGGWLNKK